MSPEKALTKLRRFAGTQFDPRVAETLEVIVGSSGSI